MSPLQFRHFKHCLKSTLFEAWWPIYVWIIASICVYKRVECCLWVCQGFCVYRASVQDGWRLKFICNISHCSTRRSKAKKCDIHDHSWALSSLGKFEIQTKTGLIPYVFWRVSSLLSQPQLYPHIGHKGKSAAGHASKKHKFVCQPKTSFPTLSLNSLKKQIIFKAYSILRI